VLSGRASMHQAGSVALMGALPQLLGSFASEPEVVRSPSASAGPSGRSPLGVHHAAC
jgi:hypothetical protein